MNQLIHVDFKKSFKKRNDISKIEEISQKARDLILTITINDDNKDKVLFLKQFFFQTVPMNLIAFEYDKEYAKQNLELLLKRVKKEEIYLNFVGLS